MSRFDSLESCSDLNAALAESAVASLDDLKAFLERCAEIAKSGEGCANVLSVVARLARGDVAWLEGDLRAELTADDDEHTVLALYTELGFGLRERLAPPTKLHVALGGIARAVELAPGLVAPLRARQESTRVVLARDVAEKSALPPPIEVDPASTSNPSGGLTASSAPTAPPASSSPHSRPTMRASVVDIEELLAIDAKNRSHRP